MQSILILSFFLQHIVNLGEKSLSHKAAKAESRDLPDFFIIIDQLFITQKTFITTKTILSRMYQIWRISRENKACVREMTHAGGEYCRSTLTQTPASSDQRQQK